MNSIDSITLEVADPAAARAFYAAAFGPDLPLRFRSSDSATDGFRGFHVSLTMAQPADVDALVGTALAAGATTIKPVAKSFWGYGGVLRAPDGTIWKVVSSSKKDKGPVSRSVESIVLLIGAEDVAASKAFYVEQGFAVARSFGRKYVEFEPGSGAVTLGLLPRKALAKDAGVPIEGTGSHRVVLHGSAGAATDPDGFVWEGAASMPGDSGGCAMFGAASHAPPGVRESGENPELSRSGEGDERSSRPLDREVREGAPPD